MASRQKASEPVEALFPRLPAGPRGMTSEQIGGHQRARLQGAMVEAVSRHGFSGTTLAELVALAGVSKSTFYEHFENKQDCFLATFDEIMRIATAQVSESYREPGDFAERLTRSLSAFTELAVTNPAAASLTAIDSLTLGTAGVPHLERASRDFERLVSQSFEHAAGPGSVSPLSVKAIVAGIRGVMYRGLRVGRAQELPSCVDALVAWVVSYGVPDSDEVKRAVEAASLPRPTPAPAEDGKAALDWREPPDSRRARAVLTQRERIVRGAALVVVERGYEALSIPAISAAAGTSNQTFYENFSSKREAFLEAFRVLAGDALHNTTAAFEAESEWPEAIGAGMRAMLEHVAANEVFARVAYFELQTAGPVALDDADTVMDAFTAFLDGGFASGQPQITPWPILAAIGSGIWNSIQYQLMHGTAADLPDHAPELTRFVVAPFGPSRA